MDTSFSIQVVCEFNLVDRNTRDSVETKISTFVASQEAGSFFRNLYREDVTDEIKPFWMRTNMTIVAASFADVVTVRNAIVNALENQFTADQVLQYQLEVKERKV